MKRWFAVTLLALASAGSVGCCCTCCGTHDYAGPVAGCGAGCGSETGCGCSPGGVAHTSNYQGGETYYEGEPVFSTSAPIRSTPGSRGTLPSPTPAPGTPLPGPDARRRSPGTMVGQAARPAPQYVQAGYPASYRR